MNQINDIQELLDLQFPDIPKGYCQCGCGQKTKIARYNDKRRGHVKGQPQPFLLRHNRTQRHGKYRFWQKVDVRGPDECWEWQGALQKGYGAFRTNHKLYRAHRYAYQLVYGPIPDGLCVCHACDNRRCINPKHLWLGTHSDNLKDMSAKGLFVAPHVKISWEQACEIRARYALGNTTYAKIAKDYPISKHQVRRIVRYVNWERPSSRLP